jgi:hypothetical protein
MSKELGHDRHIVSLLTDYIMFSPKIQAAVEFVEKGMTRAVVCRPEGVVEWMNVYLPKVIWNSGIRQCVPLVNNSSLIHTGQK